MTPTTDKAALERAHILSLETMRDAAIPGNGFREALDWALLRLAQPQWRTDMENAPRDGTRLCLAWATFKDMPHHWEVGRFRSGTGKGSGWCNTYGHSFNGEPDYWFLPAAPTPEPKQ
jgi:hypothetical protein